MKALHQRLWMLILVLFLVGCETVHYKMIVAYDDTRTWKANYSISPATLLTRVKAALEAEPLSLIPSTSTPNKLDALWVFPGRYEGIWPFGSRWDNRFSISVDIAPIQGSNQSEITLTTKLEERPNLYWGWRRAEEFGAAESQFDKIVHVVQSSVAKR